MSQERKKHHGRGILSPKVFRVSVESMTLAIVIPVWSSHENNSLHGSSCDKQRRILATRLVHKSLKRNREAAIASTRDQAMRKRVNEQKKEHAMAADSLSNPS